MFSFEIKRAYLTDSLLVSYIGFIPQKFLISTFLSNPNKTIILEEELNTLDEVVLEVKKAKYTSVKTFGENRQL
ncbi:hypothetical protein [Lacinutrix jangbogonensis]|uniref:hypothetical protein n=1 Tax=Lacinutrix jangbogonensis TaxID=1469557 RepID=UPI00053D47C8|nr:hypothetical protein [Lacinutrix jangbogonensis]